MRGDRTHCHYAIASSHVLKVQAVVFTVQYNCMVLWAEFFMYNPLGIKENKEQALDIELHLFVPFWS